VKAVADVRRPERRRPAAGARSAALGATGFGQPRLSDASVWLLALVLALPAGLIAATRGFDGLYGQDAYAYFDYATTSVRQSLQQVVPLQAFFWPPGYPLLVALASFALGPMPLAGQAVSLAMGALVPVFTALLVRELWPDDLPLALLAGALVAISGQLWQSSVVVMADTTGLALATFSAWALLRYARRNQLLWALAASAAIAYATLARWIYGLVAIPFAIYGVWLLARLERRTAVLHALAAVIVAGVIVGPLVGPSLVGLLSHPGAPAAFAGNFQVYSWSPLNALRQDFFTADGHLEYTQRNGVYYAAAPANFAYFGPLLAPWILVGLWAARKWPWPTLVLVVGWAAIVFAFHAGAPWQNFRFTLAYLPPTAVLLAVGLLTVWRFVSVRLRAVLALYVAVAMLGTVAFSVRLVEGFIGLKNQDLMLVQWVASQTAPGAQLFSFGPTLTFRHYTSLPTYDLYDLSQADVRSILASAAPTYLLLDEANVEDQWLNQAPSTNFHLLRDEPGLTELGTDGSYTLYQVHTQT
jgi:hypothetical protein